MRARSLVLLLTLVPLVAAGGLGGSDIARAQVTIQGSRMVVQNYLHGVGPTGESPVAYGFEVFVWIQEDLGTVTPADVVLQVDSQTLSITEIMVAEWIADESVFFIKARGQYGDDPTTEPLLGEYWVSVTGSEAFYIGELGDIPEDAPEMLYPEHGQWITDTTPVFQWEAFESDYLDNLVDPWAYEIELTFPDGTYLNAFPIDGSQTSLDYLTADWGVLPPAELDYGPYVLVVHSNHSSVVEGFDFEHHRAIDFYVAVEIGIDIKPQSCPNPLNIDARGVLPVAILGTDSLDVMDIDPELVMLAGVPPLRYAYEDVATPLAVEEGEDCEEDCCECTEEGPDGYLDLTLKFDIQELVLALGGREALLQQAQERQYLPLELTAATLDGQEVLGSDCVRLQASKGRGKRFTDGSSNGQGLSGSGTPPSQGGPGRGWGRGR